MARRRQTKPQQPETPLPADFIRLIRAMAEYHRKPADAIAKELSLPVETVDYYLLPDSAPEVPRDTTQQQNELLYRRRNNAEIEYMRRLEALDQPPMPRKPKKPPGKPGRPSNASEIQIRVVRALRDRRKLKYQAIADSVTLGLATVNSIARRVTGRSVPEESAESQDALLLWWDSVGQAEQQAAAANRPTPEQTRQLLFDEAAAASQQIKELARSLTQTIKQLESRI